MTPEEAHSQPWSRRKIGALTAGALGIALASRWILTPNWLTLAGLLADGAGFAIIFLLGPDRVMQPFKFLVYLNQHKLEKHFGNVVLNDQLHYTRRENRAVLGGILVVTGFFLQMLGQIAEM